MDNPSCCECCASTTNLYDLPSKEPAITILNCFAIQIETGNENHVCKTCIEKLGEANDFRNLILSTQEVLRNRKDNNICDKSIGIDVSPKQENDDHFETINDLDYYESLPSIETEFDTSENTPKNSLLLDLLKKSSCLVIKPVHKPVLKPVMKSVNIPDTSVLRSIPKMAVKPQERITIRKKLTKAQAIEMRSIPIKLDDRLKQITPTGKQLIEISRSSLRDALRLKNRDEFIMPKLDEKDFICHECKKEFHNYKTLSAHMNEHYRNYICENCGKGFATKRRLDSHMPVHSLKKSVCKECGKQFNSLSYLMSHKQRTHARVQPNKCQICGEKFHHFYNKMKHMADVHGQTEKKHKCQLCPMEFLIASKLTLHVRRKHIGRERRHICETCGAGFFDKQTLREHMTMHTGVRDFKCRLCPKAYPRKSTLREHMRIHENDRRFKCEICGQAFTQKCTLKGHMKVHQKCATDSCSKFKN